MAVRMAAPLADLRAVQLAAQLVGWMVVPWAARRADRLADLLAGLRAVQ